MEDFINELQELCEKHKVALPNDIKLKQLSEGYEEGSLKYSTIDVKHYANGTRDTSGPFLQTEYTDNPPVEEVEPLNINVAIDYGQMNARKNIPDDFKTVINTIRDSNHGSTIEGF